VFPLEYPLDRISLDELVAAEGPIPRVVDYGIIAPKLADLYRFAATSLGQPRIERFLDQGMPSYAWAGWRRSHWSIAEPVALLRLITFATRTRFT
jgi:hypothetical protein